MAYSNQEAQCNSTHRRIDFRYKPDIQQVCIGLIDDPYKTIVREDGSLNYGYIGKSDFTDLEAGNNPREHMDVTYETKPAVKSHFVDSNASFKYRLKPRFAHRDQLKKQTQEYGDPRMAIVTTVEEYLFTTLRWEVFAWYDEATGLRADVILWEMIAALSFREAPSRVELELYTSAEDGDCDTHVQKPCVWETGETTAYWSTEGVRLPGLSQYRLFRGNDHWEGAFVIVLDGELDPEQFTLSYAKEARKRMIEYWRSEKFFRNDFRVPDKAVQDMLHACGRNILQAREQKNGIVEFQVGPTLYRGLWTVDAYFILEAAQIMGRHEEAFNQGILSILRRVQRDGSIQIMPKHYKETAISIATIVRQCELQADDKRLTELWPIILRAIEYIRDLRVRAEALGPEYPGQKLFPPALVDGGIKGPYPDYATAAWTLFGLRTAAEAGERLDLPDSEKIRELYNQVYEGFEFCAHRDMTFTQEGIQYLPTIMERRPYNRPQTATWALAHAIYPGEVFPPDSPYVTNLIKLMEHIDGEEGIPVETGWIHHEGVWSYSSMFYAQVMLYAGKPEKAIDYLYAFANHAGPGRVWREEQSLSLSNSSEYCGDMPHNWASAEFIRLVRNAIIFERGVILELFKGFPPEWRPRTQETVDTTNSEPSHESESPSLVVSESPTRFGPVTVRLSLHDDGLHYKLSFRRTPGQIEPQQVIVWWNGSCTSTLIGPQDLEKEALLRV